LHLGTQAAVSSQNSFSAHGYLLLDLKNLVSLPKLLQIPSERPDVCTLTEPSPNDKTAIK